jgi:hypothetical protein
MIGVDQYAKNQWHAKFTIENSTSDPLQSARIGITCWGAHGTINGGGAKFPDLIAPSGQVVIDPSLITYRKPETCKSYVAQGM